MYCKYEWLEKRLQKMCQYLASHCNKYLENISHKFVKEVANKEILDNNE